MERIRASTAHHSPFCEDCSREVRMRWDRGGENGQVRVRRRGVRKEECDTVRVPRGTFPLSPGSGTHLDEARHQQLDFSACHGLVQYLPALGALPSFQDIAIQSLRDEFWGIPVQEYPPGCPYGHQTSRRGQGRWHLCWRKPSGSWCGRKPWMGQTDK